MKYEICNEDEKYFKTPEIKLMKSKVNLEQGKVHLSKIKIVDSFSIRCAHTLKKNDSWRNFFRIKKIIIWLPSAGGLLTNSMQNQYPKRSAQHSLAHCVPSLNDFWVKSQSLYGWSRTYQWLHSIKNLHRLEEQWQPFSKTSVLTKFTK